MSESGGAVGRYEKVLAVALASDFSGWQTPDVRKGFVGAEVSLVEGDLR